MKNHLNEFPYGYGFPDIYNNKGSLYIRVNEEEFKEITPELEYKFDFASLFTKFYSFILFETEFKTENNLYCLSQTFFDLKREDHLKTLNKIIKQGYINFIFYYEFEKEAISYEVKITDSQKSAIEKMIKIIKLSIETIPVERRNPIKALKEIKDKKLFKASFKDFLSNPDKVEEKYREYLRKNN